MAETVILDIQVNNEQAVANIQAAKSKLAELKVTQDALNKSYQDGSISQEEYRKASTDVAVATEQQKNILKANTNALKDNVRQMQSNSDSLVSLRSALKKATTEFDNLSKAEREGARGRELQNKINQLTEEVTKAEEATGRFQRNVGNYKGKVMEAFQGMGGAAGNVVNPIKNVTGAMNVMSKTPVIAILGILVNILSKVIGALKSGEEGFGRISQAMSGFKAIGDVVNNILVGMGNAIAWVVEKLGDLSAKLLGLQQRQQTNKKLAEENLALQKRERELAKQRARDERRIAQLNAEVANRNKNSAAQRKKYLEAIASLEKGIVEREKQFAEDQYNYIKKRNEQTASSQKELDEQNQAYIRMQEAQTNYYNHLATINKKTSTVVNQMTTAQVTGIKAVESEEDKAQKENEKRLKDNSKLYAEELKIRLEMAQKWSEDEKFYRAELLRYNAEQSAEEVRMSAADGQVKADQLKLIDEKLKADLLSLDKEFADHEKQIADEGSKVFRDAYLDAIDEYRQKLTNDINSISSQTIEGLTKQIELRKQLLASMYQNEGETAEAFRARQMAAENEVINAEQELANKRVEIETSKYSALASISGALSKVLQEAGSESEALTKAAKVFALAQIAFSTGEALAKGISQSQSVPFPANIGAIATTVTTVLTNIATAISTVKSAKFAQGGYVQGAGTGTSDSINAKLSNGESVMTAKATRMFYRELSAMNVAGGGRAFPDTPSVHKYALGGVVSNTDLSATSSIDAMRRAMVDAVASIHPVVSVAEINAVNNKVAVKERTARR